METSKAIEVGGEVGADPAQQGSPLSTKDNAEVDPSDPQETSAGAEEEQAGMEVVPQGSTDKESDLEDESQGMRSVARWTTSEHEQLCELVNVHGTCRKWSVIASKMVGRTGKQCRERWLNHMSLDIYKHGNWTPQEDLTLIQLHAAHGTCWSKVSRSLLGRSENSVKNHFNATWRSKGLAKRSSLLWCYIVAAKKGLKGEEAVEAALKEFSSQGSNELLVQRPIATAAAAVGAPAVRPKLEPGSIPALLAQAGLHMHTGMEGVQGPGVGPPSGHPSGHPPPGYMRAGSLPEGPQCRSPASGGSLHGTPPGGSVGGLHGMMPMKLGCLESLTAVQQGGQSVGFLPQPMMPQPSQAPAPPTHTAIGPAELGPVNPAHRAYAVVVTPIDHSGQLLSDEQTMAVLPSKHFNPQKLFCDYMAPSVAPSVPHPHPHPQQPHQPLASVPLVRHPSPVQQQQQLQQLQHNERLEKLVQLIHPQHPQLMQQQVERSNQVLIAPDGRLVYFNHSPHPVQQHQQQQHPQQQHQQQHPQQQQQQQQVYQIKDPHHPAQPQYYRVPEGLISIDGQRHVQGIY